MKSRFRKWLWITGAITLVSLIGLAIELPDIGAAAILHPLRRAVDGPPPEGCENVVFEGDGVRLTAWRAKAYGPRRGTIIYLHGISDSRRSGEGYLPRFSKLGFDVIAADSRAHGGSGGDFCTYGYWEKNDLKCLLDAVEPGPMILFGSSLGGAIALQEAAIDPRVTAVVSAESFSDLRTVVTERAPLVFTSALIARAVRIAERRALFHVKDASPMAAAKSIKVPVLIIHGENDMETPPSHARRIYDALAGPKRLLMVPGAGHNHSLQPQVIDEVTRWIDSVTPPAVK